MSSNTKPFTLGVISPSSFEVFTMKFNTEEDLEKSGFRNPYFYDTSLDPSILNPVYGLIFPIRTDSITKLAEDLFLPTTISMVRKVDTFAKKTFAFIGLFIIDTLTLPIRLLTLIPRVVIGPHKKDHKIYRFLVNKGVSDDILKGDSVAIVFGNNGSPNQYNNNFTRVPINYVSSLNFPSKNCDR